MILEHLQVGALGCTCTIVGDEATGEAIVVDGGDDVETIAAALSRLGLRARYLLHSHAHVDHIGALGSLRERVGGRGLLHALDLPLYATVPQQAALFGLPFAKPLAALDGDFRDGDAICAGAVTLRCLHTPGHTPGSTSFAIETPTGTPLILTGDTLFRGSVGRVDLGGSTIEELVHSIRERLLPYPDATAVVPGHGPATTIGRERTHNPYLTPN